MGTACQEGIGYLSRDYWSVIRRTRASRRRRRPERRQAELPRFAAALSRCHSTRHLRRTRSRGAPRRAIAAGGHAGLLAAGATRAQFDYRSDPDQSTFSITQLTNLAPGSRRRSVSWRRIIGISHASTSAMLAGFDSIRSDAASCRLRPSGSSNHSPRSSCGCSPVSCDSVEARSAAPAGNGGSRVRVHRHRTRRRLRP